MQITLSNHNILYWLEGCARGSHLRQGCWDVMIDKFKDLKNKDEQDFFYVYVKRDLAQIFEKRTLSDGSAYQTFGAEDFEKFLACYNPANRYIVTAEGNGQKGTVNCYKWKGEFRIDSSKYVPQEYVKEVKQVPFDKCMNIHCGWKDKCVRYTDKDCSNAHIYQYSEHSGCEWAIGDNETGVIEKE